MSYINRVEDSVAGALVTWTTDAPDTTGVSYPGPGVFGVDTSDYTCYLLPGSGGGGGISGYVVGFVDSGNTLGVDCTYLDTGNGAAFQQACADCDDNGGGVVQVLAGDIDFNAPGAPTTYWFMSDVSVVGDAIGNTTVTFRTSGEAIHLVFFGGGIKNMSFNAPAPTAAIIPDGPPTYIYVENGVVENVDIYGSGGDYGVTEAGYQGADTLLWAERTSIKNTVIRAVPPIAVITTDDADAFSALFVTNSRNAYTVIDDVYVEDADIGILVLDANRVEVLNSRVSGYNLYGVAIVGSQNIKCSTIVAASASVLVESNGVFVTDEIASVASPAQDCINIRVQGHVQGTMAPADIGVFVLDSNGTRVFQNITVEDVTVENMNTGFQFSTGGGTFTGNAIRKSFVNGCVTPYTISVNADVELDHNIVRN